MIIKDKMKKYENQGFTNWQKYEIAKGLRSGLTNTQISLYAKKEFD